MSADDGGDHLVNWIGLILILLLVLSVAILVVAISVPQQSAATPAVNWTLTRINENHVRLTHTGGPPVRTATLTVTVDGVPRQPEWTATILTDGESGVIRVGAASKLTLLWEQSAHDRDLLQRWTLTAATPASAIGARPAPKTSQQVADETAGERAP